MEVRVTNVECGGQLSTTRGQAAPPASLAPGAGSTPQTTYCGSKAAPKSPAILLELYAKTQRMWESCDSRQKK
ncbi:hypothetical protein PC129_g14345 [Phytophthora cactorum]|uniref:Uncharacterized protein n=1 Tax=Phytophthora cactorum TaxID=29920 RepID=A0A8T0YU27_9STRA|nr:hypothetical protein Pcac1_g22330 [Phytophthora cactorum]KAG2810530.1 hypothetical protein PC112_g16016 [Phytophthora cactorum]KAG2851228.1 hypothetical protein PC113_g16093 [Phytophthora cactorum]KAG2900559.1 hypothetical protein PC117_g21956 [Phytophthora cactorum]KAG2925590.1 hypothetical protein PC114_g4058 [Phytophthora cactorum]